MKKTTAQALIRLKASYPNYRPSDDEWEAVLAEYCDKLDPYPEAAVFLGIDRVRKKHPDWFPTLPQLLPECLDAYKEIQRSGSDERRDRALPPHPQTKPEALQTFYKRCDDMLKENSRNIDDGNQDKIDGLIVMLGAVFGFSHEQMVGIPGNEDPQKRFNTARAFRNGLRGKTGDSVSSRFSMSAAVRGIRQVPKYCRKFPTFGIIEALCEGDPLYGWDDYLVEQSTA